MSGLLVKSTNEMKMNLIELKKQGIDIPVLLGGAALTKTFVDEFCRPFYDGAIFYCRDAFDGVVSMQKIEKGEVLDTNLNVNLTKTNTSIKKEKVKFNKNIHKPILLENNHNFIPPFMNRIKLNDVIDKSLIFDWLNLKVLYRQKWGYKRGKKDRNEFLKYEKEIVEPIFYELKEQFLKKNILQPIILYRYFYCKSNDNILNIYKYNGDNL